MDADAALAIVWDMSYDPADRAAAADALADWLESGGYVPTRLANACKEDGATHWNVRDHAIRRMQADASMAQQAAEALRRAGA